MPVSKFRFAAAVLASASFFASSTATAAPLSPEKLEQLASFCTAKGAFGQQFGMKAELINPNPVQKNFVVLYTVKSDPGWAPFSQIQVQRTPKTELVYRVYGTAVFETPEEARSALNALSSAVKAAGYKVQVYPDSIALSPASSGPLPDFDGMIEINGSALMARCGDWNLARRSVQENSLHR